MGYVAPKSPACPKKEAVIVVSNNNPLASMLQGSRGKSVPNANTSENGHGERAASKGTGLSARVTEEQPSTPADAGSEAAQQKKNEAHPKTTDTSGSANTSNEPVQQQSDQTVTRSKPPGP